MTQIADTISRAAQAVEEFRGDHEELAALMRASWVDGAGAPYLYTADLLADWLRYPGAQQAPRPAIYTEEGLVAFAAGLPRTVEVGGVPRRILISTLLTVAPAQKAAGYGIVVWSELMRRAAAGGYDGVVNYCADGEAMHRMIETGCRLLELPLTRVRSFSYLVGRLGARPPGGASAQGPAPSELVVAATAQGAQHLGEGVPALWRDWSRAEAEWQLSRLGSVAVGTDDAVLTGSVVTVADDARSRYLVIDDVLWGSAGEPERRGLVGGLLAQAAGAGASFAVVPVMGYADLGPFVAAAGLVPSPHTMHAYLSLWSDPEAAQPVERYYLDVI